MKVINAKYIYEFDLSKFFDKVRLIAIAKALKDRQVPIELIKKIVRINSSLVEQAYDILGKSIDEDWLVKDSATADGVKDHLFPMDQKIQFSAEEYGALHDLLTNGIYCLGCAQGANTSPFLSNIILCDAMDKLLHGTDVKVLLYADDGMFYTDTKEGYETICHWMQEYNLPKNI